MQHLDVDYIVVGSGSAGAIVAARLSEDPQVKVLLLEAGPASRSPIISIPAATRYAYNTPKFNWGYETEPEPHLGGRRLSQLRGRVLGGSSSINGMVYLRGNPLDYEGWSEAGAAGWAYADVLPYFQRLEGWVDPTTDYQGRDGPVGVSAPEPLNELAAAFLRAGEEAGYPMTPDINGRQQEGFGRFPVNAAGGYRWNTERAYLRPAANRGNLIIHTDSTADRIEFEGRRAVAVSYRRGGAAARATAAREIVICGGAINSPKLLLLSGIGPAAQLREHGIDVTHDLPGVGENLMDHQLLSVQVESLKPVSLYSHINPLAQARAVLRWLVRKDGLLSHNHFQCGAFIRSEAGVRFPDIQLYMFPVLVKEGSKDFMKMHGFVVQVSPQRTLSRGWVRLRSADVDDHPRILFNAMSHERDWFEMRQSFHLAREVIAQPAFDPYRGREITPGADVASDDAIDGFVRDHVVSSYHPSGTCKMGTDAMAVVDPECRVHGLQRLRIVDASIMPLIPSCNLNSPSMMIGEKGADLIRGQRLPPSNLDYHVDEEWRTRQRPGTPQRAVM